MPEKYQLITPFNREALNNGLYLGIKSLPLSPKQPYLIREVKVDSLTGLVKIEEKIAGILINNPYLSPEEEYLEKSKQKILRNLFKNYFSENISPTEKKEDKAKGLGFRIPVPLGSKDFSVGIDVTGNINMTAKIGHQSQTAVRSVHQGSDYTVKLEQTQQFKITGTVGDKIQILVDQNSERSFEFENNLRLTYQGEEDEVFKNIQAGNIGLALKGTQFVSFSGANKGLFGLKADMQVGPLNITTIASLEKGQKQKLSLKGGAKSEEDEIKDYQYVPGKFFFVDHEYRENYRFDEKGNRIQVPSNLKIKNIEIWKSDKNYNAQRDVKYGWAVADPANPDTVSGKNQFNINGYFLRLEKNKDYYLDESLGQIEFQQSLQNEFIGIAYETEEGEVVGQLVPEEGKPLILRLLRTDYPIPTDECWDLEMRNVYRISSGPISADGLEIKIIANKENPVNPVQKGGKNYLEVFGLDRLNEAGRLQSDDKIDVKNGFIFRLTQGLLFMPGLRPFDPENDPFNSNIEPMLIDEKRVPSIYDTVFQNRTDYEQFSQFSIMVKTSSMSASYSLGMNVLENSEEVLLDGVPLQKGVDYEIDYSFGELTILNQKATQPGANLEINYESAEIFQIEKKTILGTRAEYYFDQNSFIGGTILYKTETTLEQRVKVGNEPVQNLIWDLNTNLRFEPKFITNFLDMLPMISTDKPSSISFQGEIAQIVPKPNTMNNPKTGDNSGVAFIDDFEGSKRVTTLMTRRKSWTLSSVPPDILNENRDNFIWYNPYYQVKIKEILPNKDVNTNTTQTVNVLIFKNNSEEADQPENPWGGIMTALHTSYYNQTETKFLEFWVKGDTGIVNIDLGLISEDAIPNGILDTEDKNFNGILDDGEDTGIDGISAKDGTNALEPFPDDWKYEERSNDYRYINGTENNEKDGIREPDTEDINRSGSLDTRNDYFEYTLDIGRYSIYQVENYENESGWKFYRIPIGDFTKQVGEPDLARIEYARVWTENIPAGGRITIYKIDLVGNDWKPIGLAPSDSASFKFNFTKNEDKLKIGVVNSEDDYPLYHSPPGVEGIQDRITKVKAKEQSLLIEVEDLEPGQTAMCQKSFYDKFNLIHYTYMKLFVYGDETLSSDSSDIELIMRMGKDDVNYYEIREPIYRGWDERNEFKIPLAELARTKLSAEIDDFGYRTQVLDGKLFRVVGNPTLREISRISFGLRNITTYKYISADIWIDELRLSEVEEIKGIAYRASGNLQLADIATITGNIQKTEADFHSINESFGTGNNTTSSNITVNFNANRLYSAKQIFDIPVTIGYSKSKSTPKYRTGSDILLSTDLPDSIYSREISEKVDKRISIGFKKSMPSQNWILKNTIDNLSLNYSHTSSEAHDYNTELNEKSSTQLGVNYGLNFPDKFVKPLFFMQSIPLIGKIGNTELHFIPSNFSYNGSANETNSLSKLRGAEFKPSRTFTTSQTLSMGISPLKNLKMDISRSFNNDLQAFDKGEIFKGIFDSDSTLASMNQKFTTTFNPTFFNWLKNNFSYSAIYNINNNITNKDIGKAASLNKNLTGDFSLNFKNLLQSLGLNLEQSQGGSQSGPIPGDNRQNDSKNNKSKQQEKKGGLKLSFGDLKSFINSFQDIKINLGKTLTSSELGLENSPGFDYMLGLKNETGIPILETAGQQSSLQESNKISLGTGFSLSKYINVSLNYAKNSSENTRGATKTGTESVSVGASGDKPAPFPNWGIRCSNLEKFVLFKPIFKSLSITHKYSGQLTETKQGLDLEPIKKAYSKSYSPLMQAQMTLFFGLKVNLSLSKTTNFVEDLSTNTANKDITNAFQISTGFQKSGGFRIPLPFLNKKRLENTISVNLAYSKNSTTGWKTDIRGVTSKDRETRDWSFKPNITYSFTNRINGSLQFNIGKNYNFSSGERKIVEGSISVNIVISG